MLRFLTGLGLGAGMPNATTLLSEYTPERHKSLLVTSMFCGFNLGMAGGAEVVSSAFAITALVFCGLSAYVLTTRKDMTFLAGFITAGFFVLLGATLASVFFEISGLQLAISAGFVLFSSVCILFQTSAIIHGGERNYIMATISLYVSIYNLFISLLQLLGEKDHRQ